MTNEFIENGILYADEINLARGILDSAGEYIKAANEARRIDEMHHSGQYDEVVRVWGNLIEARETAWEWAALYSSRRFPWRNDVPMTPAETTA